MLKDGYSKLSSIKGFGWETAAINISGDMNGSTFKDYPTPAVRPLNSRLDSFRVEAHFGYKASDWKAGVSGALTY